jgi:rod shape-determining protein MreD
VTLLDATKAAALLFVAAILQVSVFNSVSIFGGTPDVLLITLIAVSLLRGSITGAVCGFFAGLVVDTATLDTLGLTSLLLILAGYWTGRYGETTGRDKSHAPLLAVGVITILYAILALVLRFLLGESESAQRVLLDALPPSLLLNLLITVPVYAFTRWVVGARRVMRAQEVRLIE